MTDAQRVITILHVCDCPNLAMARGRIEAALEQAGVDALIEEVLVASDPTALTSGFRGSPTILIDGHDPFEGEVDHLGCRLYVVNDHIEGAPSVGQLQTVLETARLQPPVT
jgi:hypothetical protein